MKFIELHDETDTRWVNVTAIKMIEAITSEMFPKMSSYILLDDSVYYFSETPEEILQKITEAEQRELEMISEEKRHQSRGSTEEFNAMVMTDNDFCSREERKEETEC